jgi:hypothetical protein
MDNIELSPTESELVVEADISTQEAIASDTVEAVSEAVDEATEAVSEPAVEAVD